MRISCITALVLTGCGGGGGLSDEEIEEVFAAAFTVGTDVQNGVSTSTAGLAKDLHATGSSGDWEISGTIEGSGVWSGTLEVDGSGSHAPGSTRYSLDLGYDLVTYNDIDLDGQMSYDMDSSIVGSDFSYTYEMVGELEVSGDAKGKANIDIAISLDSDGSGAYTYTFEGTINDNDISSFGEPGTAGY